MTFEDSFPKYEGLNSFLSTLEDVRYSVQMIMSNIGRARAQEGKTYEKIFDEYGVKNEESGNLAVYGEHAHEISKIETRIYKLTKTLEIVPSAVFVHAVSAYDAYINDFIQLLMLRCPHILEKSEKKIDYAKILEFSSIDAVKEYVIQSEAESVMRGSHSSQIEWLSKVLKVKFEEFIPHLSDLTEISERRNVHVHNKGKANNIYLSKVSKIDAASVKDIKCGDYLKISPDYIRRCADLFSQIASQITIYAHKNILKDDSSLEQDDDFLIHLGFDHLVTNKAQLAKHLLLPFVNRPKLFYLKSSELYCAINLAIAYKKLGKNANALEILEKYDFEILEPKYKLAHACLTDNNAKSIELLAVGVDKVDDYALEKWPLFQWLRETNEFKRFYFEKYGKELGSKEHSNPNLQPALEHSEANETGTNSTTKAG